MTTPSIFGTGFSPLQESPRLGLIPIPQMVVRNDATVTGITLLASDLLGGLILHAPTGAVNDTLDTAAAIIAAIPGVTGSLSNSQGACGFYFDVVNTTGGSNTITIVAGVGGTITGTATIAQNNGKRFLLIVTNATVGSEAYTVYSLGTYTF